MPFLTDLTQLIIKPETVRGTYSNPAQADHNLFVSEIEVDTTVDSMLFKFQDGGHAEHASIPGARMGKVSFTCPLTIGANLSAGDAPTWAKLFSHGYGCYVGATAGSLTISPHLSADQQTSSIAVQYKQPSGNAVTYMFSGAIGVDGEVMYDKTGNPFLLKASFQGAWTSAADIPVIERSTSLDSPNAPSNMNGSMTALSVAKNVSKFSLKLGVKSNLQENFSDAGYLGGYIGSRSARIEIDPYMSLLATDDIWTNLRAGTQGTFACQSGPDANGVRNSIACPKVQLIDNKGADRNDAKSHSQTWACLKDGLNDAVWVLTQA